MVSGGEQFPVFFYLVGAMNFFFNLRPKGRSFSLKNNGENTTHCPCINTNAWDILST